MNTALVKPSKAIKGMTSMVRTHLDAVEHAREIYLAQIKRAEADYFERMKRIMGILQEDAPPEAPKEQPVNNVPAA
jgi:hypothetical protein